MDIQRVHGALIFIQRVHGIGKKKTSLQNKAVVYTIFLRSWITVKIVYCRGERWASRRFHGRRNNPL